MHVMTVFAYLSISCASAIFLFWQRMSAAVSGCAGGGCTSEQTMSKVSRHKTDRLWSRLGSQILDQFATERSAASEMFAVRDVNVRC